ncbi:FtsX-like permease family protein [Actinokineospora terrae]|uniref:Putative ABC transport system permease protein n=1 Tax=Actinokineospora terrae TaxID=155974 RepID=A0A1H9NWH5_9PSEU|nr:ABC transporter permease [Actinokineospora terrae]SER40394.1 putative ABC transport system permease protein [Actinokineospora terrae]
MLSVASLKSHWTTFVGTFVAVFLGVAILSMTASVLLSAQPAVPDRYRGSPVVAQSSPVDQQDSAFTDTKPWSAAKAADLVRSFEALPGVARAIPDRTFYAQPVLGGVPVVGVEQGHPWSSVDLAPYRLVSGSAPTAAGEIAVSRTVGVGPGTTLTVLTAAGAARYLVVGTVDGPGVYLSDGEAGRVSPGVRVIGLRLDPGADEDAVQAGMRAALGGDGQVLAGAARVALEPMADQRVRWIGDQVLTGLGSLGGFVSIFVVASTFAFVVVQRRRELGLLRALGATPRQIRRMLLGEAVVIGVVGGALGVGLGAIMAPVLGDLLVSAGLEPPTFTVETRFLPLASAFVVGLLVAVAGVWAAGRRAARIRPLEALREAAVETKPMTRARWWTGGVCTGLGLLLVVFSVVGDPDDMMTNSLYAAMALIVGGTLLAPVVIPPLVRVLTYPLAGGALGLVVRESALTSVRRTASTAAPVLLTVGLAVLVAGMVETSTGGYAVARELATRAEVVVLPNGTPGLSAEAVAATPGAALLPTELYGDNSTHYPATGVDPVEFAKTNTRLTASIAGLSDPDTAVLTESAAHRLGVRPGDTTGLTFEDGQRVNLRVVALLPDASSPTPILLPRQTVREHAPSALTSAVHVSGPVPASAPLGAQVLDRATYAANADAEEDRLVRIFVALLLIVALGYAALSIANTLLMSTAGRITDFTTLRRAGATRRQVTLAVAGESILVVTIGAALGFAIALTALYGMTTGLSHTLGAPVPLSVPWPVPLAAITTSLALALTATTLPTHLSLREHSLT